ncbi:MAG: chorismate-binding protein [Bacteroidota bacterium]|nr:chorismate-binding protein [Bacteroidota bacterium]
MSPETIDAFAIFRLPHNEKTQIISGSTCSGLISLSALTGETAFIVSPFNKKDQVFAIRSGTILDFNPLLFPDLAFHCSKNVYTDFPKQHYLSIVEKAISQIRYTKHFDKVVLSRTKSVELNMFNPLKLFSSLSSAYPNAFVYLVSSPETGTWMGATPELLLSSNAVHSETVALAGTLPNNKQDQWGEKEIEEQQMVEIYIESVLNQESLKYVKTGPADLITGNIKHLQTRYQIENSNSRFNNSAANLISKLNPTPAVAGMPKEYAIRFIAENEGYNRGFYSGFVGITRASDQQLFVNLRCLELQENKATLFAGAGITRNSNPESEFYETERKMDAILNYLV